MSRVQVSSLNDRDVIYITGRDKSQKSKNGKSANLNNTLGLIYPEVRDPRNNDEFMKIPINELMCLFDADQTCSKVHNFLFDQLCTGLSCFDRVGTSFTQSAASCDMCTFHVMSTVNLPYLCCSVFVLSQNSQLRKCAIMICRASSQP